MKHPRAHLFVLTILAATLLTATGGRAQELKEKTLAICAITQTPALVEAQTGGKKNELDRVIQSMDGQLIDRMHKTGKFKVMAHSDLPDIVKGGAFNPDTLKSMPKLDYVLVVAVDDFGNSADSPENGLTFQNARLSAVAKIWATKDSTLLETANFQLQPEDLPTGGVVGDQILVQAARKMADRMANHVTYRLSPPEVQDVTGKAVTIDWGDGLSIKPGDKWEVCVPKTNKKGFVTLVPVGDVEIKRVDPTSSTAEIIGEDRGIAEGCILRKQQLTAAKKP